MRLSSSRRMLNMLRCWQGSTSTRRCSSSTRTYFMFRRRGGGMVVQNSRVSTHLRVFFNPVGNHNSQPTIRQSEPVARRVLIATLSDQQLLVPVTGLGCRSRVCQGYHGDGDKSHLDTRLAPPTIRFRFFCRRHPSTPTIGDHSCAAVDKFRNEGVQLR